MLIGRYFLQPLFHWLARSEVPEIFTASTVLLALGVAAVTEHIAPEENLAGVRFSRGGIANSFNRDQYARE